MGIFDHKKLSANSDQLLGPNSPFAYAEAYKTLRTNLSFASVSKQYKKIILTSAIPDEGKSTIAVNLAATLAETGAKVLLMDCDLRNPTLHRLLRVKNGSVGRLTAILTGKATADDCIFTHPKMNCDFIMAGAVPPNPAELLGSERMEKLLDELSQRYDYVICDTPPVGLVTDAAALSRFCDGVILVVRQNLSTKEQVRTAKRNLEAVQANIIGTILSCYDLSKDTKDSKGTYAGYYNYGVHRRRKPNHD